VQSKLLRARAHADRRDLLALIALCSVTFCSGTASAQSSGSVNAKLAKAFTNAFAAGDNFEVSAPDAV
jgi:hypothetical protein